MANEWNVLTVDDEVKNMNELERIFSKGTGFDGDSFNFTKVTSFADGLELIRTARFDFIFLDVHDNAGDPDPNTKPSVEDQKGEELLHALKKIRFSPVIFYTGYPKKVEHLSSPVVRILDKGATVDEVRDEVKAILDTKLPHLSNYIENESRKYIWETLDTVWDKIPDISPPDLSLLLARRLANNLSENVVKGILGISKTHIKPLEMYIYPPSDICSPGDIYQQNDDQRTWIVSTPACDFEQNKAQNVLLARVKPISDHEEIINVKTARKNKEEADPSNADAFATLTKKVEKAMGRLTNLLKDGLSTRYKFLPGTFFFESSYIDFQDVKSINLEENTNYTKVCTLDSPYREEVINLFSKYYGRIGTPDLKFADTMKVIEENYLAD